MYQVFYKEKGKNPIMCSMCYASDKTELNKIFEECNSKGLEVTAVIEVKEND